MNFIFKLKNNLNSYFYKTLLVNLNKPDSRVTNWSNFFKVCSAKHLFQWFWTHTRTHTQPRALSLKAPGVERALFGKIELSPLFLSPLLHPPLLLLVSASLTSSRRTFLSPLWRSFPSFHISEMPVHPSPLLSQRNTLSPLSAPPLLFFISLSACPDTNFHTRRTQIQGNARNAHAPCSIMLLLHIWLRPPEPEECECFSRAYGWTDGWMQAENDWWTSGPVLTQPLMAQRLIQK